MKLGEAVDPYIDGMDVEAFRQCMLNVLANMPQGGKIIINPPVSFPVAVGGKVVSVIRLEGDRIGYD